MTPWQEYERESDAINKAQFELNARSHRMFAKLERAQAKCNHSKYPSNGGMFCSMCSNCGMDDL